jgi:putative DNA primase/helicase
MSESAAGYPKEIEDLSEEHRQPRATSSTPPEPEWPERQPIPEAHDPVPNLGVDLLPESLAPWIADAAERVSVPLEYIAGPALVAAAGIVGRKVGILPKRRDDWTVVPNTWGGIVGPTGVMKSSAVAEGFRPVRRLAAEATKEFESGQTDCDAEQVVLETRIAGLRNRAKKAAERGQDVDEYRGQIAELLREQQECVAVERRYLTQDATVEKIGELLKENPRGITLLRDELAGWLRTLDRPGREGDREFYLEAWNGDGAYTYDRIGRGTLHIPALTLSLFGGIQPSKLQTYIEDALDHRQGDDGLIQRVQILIWPDSAGEWRNVDRWPDTEARERAFHIYRALDGVDPEERHATPVHPDAIPALRFSEEAQELFDAWRDDLENRLRGEAAEATPSFAGHLAKYRSLMPTLALLFHLIDSLGQGTRGPVSIDAAQRSAAWCEYLELHARKIYGAELRGGVPAARRLAERIRRGDVGDGMTVRDLVHCEWSGLRRTEVVQAGLEVLQKAGWVQVAVMKTGGRPSQVVRVHPELRGGDDG